MKAFRSMAEIVLAAVAVLVGLSECAAASGTPTETYRGPLVAELMAYLQVRHVQPGASVYVRVVTDWNGSGCTLRHGSVIEAKVKEAVAHSKTNAESDLALAFPKAQCGGKELSEVNLVLAAVVASVDEKDNPSSLPEPALRDSFMPAGGSPVDTIINMRARQSTSAVAAWTAHHDLKLGDVVGINGLTLHVGAGPERSTVLSEAKHDVALERNTEFLLVPASVAFVPRAMAPHAEQPAEEGAAVPKTSDAAPVADLPPPTEFEPCQPPNCTEDLAVAIKQDAGVPAKSFELRSLGYSPRLQRELEVFDDDASLAWLSSQELLLAFNPHRLISRSDHPGESAPVRMIKAVVLDAATGKVEKTAYWDLSDFGPILWQLSGNRVLVHVGDELRIYSAGLTLESRIPLQGRLAFVRISPNGEMMTVAILKERHTAELHNQLRDSLGHDPEEDVSILILDKDLKTVSLGASTSEMMPPTLLNEGQVRLLAKPNQKYRLAMLPWSGGQQTIARFSSTCVPHVSSFAPDLLFVRTCNKANGAAEFQILRADGSLVLRGHSDSGDIGQEAAGTGRGAQFAVKVVHASTAILNGSIFHGSDLDWEEVRVYLVKDGKRVSTWRVNSPSPTSGGYALSPDEAQLAVFSGTSIRLFTVAAQGAK